MAITFWAALSYLLFYLSEACFFIVLNLVGNFSSLYLAYFSHIHMVISFLFRIIAAAGLVEKERSRRLGTSILNQVVNEALAFKAPPRTRGGRRGRVYYCTQVLLPSPSSLLLYLEDEEEITENIHLVSVQQLVFLLL